MKFTGINHLAMVTHDMDTTIRFWRDLLGMRLVAGLGKPGYRHYFFEVSEHDLLAFFEWPGAEAVPEKDHGYPLKGPIIFDHVSFSVEKEDDLRELQVRLSEHGFWVSEIIDHGFILSIYTFDPNGIPIEFSWNTENIDVRETPVLVDSSPTMIALEGPEPQEGRWAKQGNGNEKPDGDVYPGEGKSLVDGTKRNWFK